MDGTCFHGWDVADWLEQTALVEPADPIEGSIFNALEAAPRAAMMDDLGLYWTFAFDAPNDASEAQNRAIRDAANSRHGAHGQNPLSLFLRLDVT